MNAPSDALLERLRCPVSGESLFLEGEQLVSESGKHRYELRAGRIPLFCEDPASVGARRQQAHYDRVAAAYLENLAYPHTREYTAHLDHIGELAGVGHEDAVNNGAMDNASGISVMLETARKFTGLEPPEP